MASRKKVEIFPKNKITLEKDGNLIRINKKWYAFQVNNDGDFRTGEHILVEVDKERIDRAIKTITDSLFTYIDPKLVLADALKDMTQEELLHLEKYIRKHGKRLYPKIRKHCIAMRIAGVEIPIR